LTSSHFDSLFNLLDKDKDGYISREDFQNLDALYGSYNIHKAGIYIDHT